MTCAARRILSASALALATAALAACGAGRPTRYYQLSIPAAPAALPSADAYPVSLLVERLTAPELYRGADMVYRTGPEELGIYEYHRWAASPAEMLGMILVRRLRESGRYRSVELLRSRATGNYVLRGHLYDFEEVDGPPLVARLSLEIDLEEASTGGTVWSHFYAHDQPVPGKGRGDVSAVVEALDANVEQAIGEITAGLDHYFSTHPPG
ncbi:MAG TPA: ABC-type transport auxiliary lipoprotein family protein [Candidatus Acidoferrales bacterium]|nr:ABC-type transport auxiliary lipoprotein family protein [Candidatus Acidoferrales bacterium]